MTTTWATLHALWVCESCGALWELVRGERPARDHHGGVLCEPCRLFAGIAPEVAP